MIRPAPLSRVILVVLALLVGAAPLASCGSGARHGFVIPTAGGNERESLASGPLTIDRLVARAQAELDRAAGTPGAGAAEVWLRRALQLDPEHPGALVVLARLAIARGDRQAARRPLELAARRAPEVDGERLENLVALAGDELDRGRAGAASALLTLVERELPQQAQSGARTRSFRDERHALHRRLAEVWLGRNLREAARASIEAAGRLGRSDGRAAVQLEALDRGALQQGHAEDVLRTPGERLALARWLARHGRPEDADWAIAAARDADPEPAELAAIEGAAAEIALTRDRPAEARERWLAAAKAAPADGTEILADGAERLYADGFPDDGAALLDAGLAMAPGDARLARARVRAAMALKDPATITRVVVAFVTARPEAWARAFDWVHARGERWPEVAEAVLAAARAAGQPGVGTRVVDVAAERASVPTAVARVAAEGALAPVPRGLAEAFVDQRAARLVRAWAALGPEPEGREICATLHRLTGARAMPETRLAIVEAWLAAPADGGDAPPWSALGDAYLRLDRFAEAEAAYAAALDQSAGGSGGGPQAGPSAEVVADRLRAQDRWDEALRFFDRLHVNEIQNVDVLPELARRLAMRGDEPRFDEVVARFLALARDKAVAAPKIVAFADQMPPAIAVQAYQLAIDAGDRTPRAFVGWVRALVRTGDDDGAERAANRFLGERPRRDARATDELAKALADEGRVTRAAELILGRFAEGERMDPNALAPLADLLRRAGRDADLVALVERYIAADARNPQRSYQVGAQRLVEAGLVKAAAELVGRGLEVRPRDPTMLSSALSLAVLRRDRPRVEDLAKRLFQATPAGSAVDVYERVIGDVRAGAMPDAAITLADEALARLPGTSRLLAARGRVHLLAGRRDMALQDFADAVLRGGFVSAGALAAPGAAAVSPRELLGPLETLMLEARMPGELALVEARAMAQAPGRADVVIPYGRALLLAGKAEEAEQVFARFLADNDRGHATVAEAWFAAGAWRRALDHWAKGMDQVSDQDAPQVLARVAAALAAIGEPERLDPFVRLFVQALDGRPRAGLLPVAQAYEVVGRADDALHWLARAEESSPTADLAFMLGKGYLARGDHGRALAALERSIGRRAAEALPTQSTSWFGGAATQPVVNLLLDHRRAADARALVTRVEGLYGASAWTKLLGARAALAEGDLAAVLERLAGPLPPWRTNRDLLPTLRALLDELLDAGHGEAAMGVIGRALESGAEKELVVGALRVAARAGHPEVALAAAERFAAEHQAAQAWLAAEALVAEGLTLSGREAVTEALAISSVGPALTRAAGALHAVGDDIASVLARARALGDDRIERAVVLLQVHRLAGPITAADNPDKALAAIAPLLDQSFQDPSIGRHALIAAALADERGDGRGEGRLRATLATLMAQTPERGKWARTAARDLGDAGLAGAALDALELVTDSEGGDGSLALQAIELALAAGRVSSPTAATWEAWRARVPVGAIAELAQRLVDLERADLALSLAPARETAANDASRFAAAALGEIERSTDPEEARKQCAWRALARVGRDDGAWARAGRGCIDPWIDEGGVDRTALELGLALAWHDGDAALAARRATELATRFPGPLAQPLMLVEAAIVSGDGAGLERLLDRPMAVDVDDRVRLCRQALAGAELLGGAVAPAVLEVLARVVREAPAADPDAAELGVLVEHLRATSPSSGSSAAASLAAAEAAHARQPRSTTMVLVLAGALMRQPDAGSHARAEALLVEASRRPGQAGLFDLDPMALVGRDRGLILAALGRLDLARGEPARAASRLREAATLIDLQDLATMGPLLVARGDALLAAGRRDAAIATWTDALRRGSWQSWARAARQRIAAGTPR